MDTQLLSLVITLALIAAAFGLIWVGWRNRLKRQADVEQLPLVPEAPGEPLTSAEGQYVASTTGGDWLDRIAVHGLGIRTNATMKVYPDGVLFDRAGAPALYIPATSLSGVRLDSGMAGKFVEKDGLLVLSWVHGSHDLDTGFRTRRAEDRNVVFAALQELISSAPAADANSGK
ncbi:PH-like domain-containing protein [Arthrobacter sp. Z4-13]